MFFSIPHASSLVLGLYALGIQAAPAVPITVPTNVERKVVSILNLINPSSKVLQSGNVTYKHSLPEVDESYFYIQDGIKLYNYPEGTKLPHEFWEERGIAVNHTE